MTDLNINLYIERNAYIAEHLIVCSEKRWNKRLHIMPFNNF